MAGKLTLRPTELLDISKHDRSSFKCGVSELDLFFQERARKESELNLSKTFVLTAEEVSNGILGYYTISPKHINTTDLPSELTKRLPKYNELGVTLLGRFAIAEEFQRTGHGLGTFLHGLGTFLLNDVKYRVWNLATGSFGIVVDVLVGEKGDPTDFYRSYDFIPFLDNPRKLFLPMKTIEQTLRKAGLI